MENADRMMIAGLALQGILANPETNFSDRAGNTKLALLYADAMSKQTFEPSKAANALAIARVCHEVNRAWCGFNKDFSQYVWDDAPDWQKESVLTGVLFHLQHPDADDSASHIAWMVDKAADGWTYGPVKNHELKTHPCMVAFNELPAEQQFKDRLFRTIVHAMAHQPAPLEA